MSTKDSPPWQLAAQAKTIASHMKKAERREIKDPRILAARDVDPFKVGVVMDDKLITIEMTWAAIKEAAEPDLAVMILTHMREETEQ
jgi:hypothetical protein